MTAIELRNLSKSFGPVKAVDDVSFAVEAGTVTGYLGPNGAGKTTTLRCLLGLVRADSGAALVNGRPYVELERPLSEVGAVLEATNFHPGRSARNHLRVMCTAAGLPVSRADEALEQVGLTDAADKRVAGFSLGMRQRLGLAAALLGHPRCSSSTSPPTAWTRRASSGCAASCATSPMNGARPCWSPATCCRRWSRPSTTW